MTASGLVLKRPPHILLLMARLLEGFAMIRPMNRTSSSDEPRTANRR